MVDKLSATERRAQLILQQLLRAGFSRSDVSNRNFTSRIPASSLGLSPNATQNFGLPLIGFPGYGNPVTSTDPRAYQAGGSTFFDNRVRDNSVHLSDFVTYIRGRHSMKFGGELRLQQLNNAAHFDIGGNFNFRSNQTGNTNDFNQGWPIASLITGRPEFSFNSNQTIDPALRFFSNAFFFQDDVKVTPRLKLNLGIRYDYGRPREEARGFLRGFDPNTANPAAGGRLGAIVGAIGQGGLQAEYFGLVEPDRTNFGPRLGFAYYLNDKTVVRGGYGIYYAPVICNDFGNTGVLGYSPGAVNINFGNDAFITLENSPLVPEKIGTINPNIYGHFVEHLGAVVNDGIWVGESSRIPNQGGIRTAIVDALKKIKAPVIRYPGGCFADSYNWRDGIGDRAQRPRRTNFWVDEPDSKAPVNSTARVEPNWFGRLPISVRQTSDLNGYQPAHDRAA